MAAGLLFTNEKLFLAGYKSFKSHITGIGGKPHETDTSKLSTAIRETIEELFGVKEVSNEIIEHMLITLQPFKEVTNDSYTHFLCSFDDLKCLLTYCYLRIQISPYYSVFPTTIEQLLLERKNTERAEIAQLCLLPFSSDLRIARHLMNDINLCVMPASTK
jgi:hypothetical protein